MDERYVIIQPALEPDPKWTKKIGPMMAFMYVRWSSWGLGIELMHAGFAVQIGPVMFGACFIQAQREAFDAKRDRLVSISPNREERGL